MLKPNKGGGRWPNWKQGDGCWPNWRPSTSVRRSHCISIVKRFIHISILLIIAVFIFLKIVVELGSSSCWIPWGWWMFLSVATHHHHVIFKVFDKRLYVVVLVKRAGNMINIKWLDPLLYCLGIVSDCFLVVLVLSVGNLATIWSKCDIPGIMIESVFH